VGRCDATADSLREWKKEKQVQQQIPSGNGRKKSKCNSRFPPGMEERKASATAESQFGWLRGVTARKASTTAAAG
jgi:hypothetical protein